MNLENQRPFIRNSLKVAMDIFQKCQCQYRIVGSVLIVALTNQIFRKIGDIDLLLDHRSFHCVLQKLKKLGFTIYRKRLFVFPWIEAKKEGCLGFTFLLVGDFSPNGFLYRIGKWIEIRVRADYIHPTEYAFEGVRFLGLPVNSIASGIQQAFFNPKRQLDKQMVKPYLTSKVLPYGQINIYLFGIRVPYLYDVYSFSYNLIGAGRVLLGKKYEFWE